jgi:hypothetical protein
VDHRLLHRVLARISATALVRGRTDLNRPAKSAQIRMISYMAARSGVLDLHNLHYYKTLAIGNALRSFFPG